MQSEHSRSPLSSRSMGTVLQPRTAAVWKLLSLSAQKITTWAFQCVFASVINNRAVRSLIKEGFSYQVCAVWREDLTMQRAHLHCVSFWCHQGALAVQPRRQPGSLCFLLLQWVLIYHDRGKTVWRTSYPEYFWSHWTLSPGHRHKERERNQYIDWYADIPWSRQIVALPKQSIKMMDDNWVCDEDNLWWGSRSLCEGAQGPEQGSRFNEAVG